MGLNNFTTKGGGSAEFTDVDSDSITNSGQVTTQDLNTDVLNFDQVGFLRFDQLRDVNTDSVTVNLNNPSNNVLVVSSRSGGTGFDRLQINGDTGPNYDVVDSVGNNSTGNNSILLGRFPPDVNRFRMVDDRGGRIRGSLDRVGTETNDPTRFTNIKISGPVSSFKLFDSGATPRQARFAVFTRSI
jgi:hypothetical protein